MLLSIAAVLGYKIYMMNVQMAFLNANLGEEVFVKMHPGYDRSNKAGIPLVVKLENNLYELCQNSKPWFGTMYRCLGDMDFARSSLTRASTFTRTRSAS